MNECLEFAQNFDEKTLKPELLDNKVVELENRRQQLSVELINAKKRSVEKLKECAEMKFGPRQESVAKLIEENAAREQIKAS